MEMKWKWIKLAMELKGEFINTFILSSSNDKLNNCSVREVIDSYWCGDKSKNEKQIAGY